jgi:predicted membrane protein
METNYNRNTETPETEKPWAGKFSNLKSGRLFGGLIIITVGILLLIRQMGFDLPDWLISWEVLLIVLGLYVGVRHSFRGPAWFILIALGSIFLIDDFDPTLSVRQYAFPVAIIIVGLIVMLRPKSSKFSSAKIWEDTTTPAVNDPLSPDDVIDSVSIFGAIKKNIISKNFRGGEITTIFGGSELNLTQADSHGRIVIEITQIFAGTKLIVPPHWRIHAEEVVSIFGGLDDKRPPHREGDYDNNKVLILKGTSIFGGIDIKSF